MKLCDLHTHSVYSDGTDTPAGIVSIALKSGLSAVALCDHNTVDGLSEFIKAANGKKIKAIAGAEFSVDYLGTELHLLGLFIPESSFPQVSYLMQDVKKRKEKSNFELIHLLNKAGYSIDFERIKSSTPSGSFNRAHIAEELTRKGYTASILEAFRTLLSPECGFYKEPKRISVFEMLDFLKNIGAVPVLAHPFLNLNEKNLRELLPQLTKKGLIGMECLYSSYSSEETEKSLLLAKEFGLKCSGGSDYHGNRKPDIELGTGKGNLAVPYTWAEELEDFIK